MGSDGGEKKDADLLDGTELGFFWADGFVGVEDSENVFK